MGISVCRGSSFAGVLATLVAVVGCSTPPVPPREDGSVERLDVVAPRVDAADDAATECEPPFAPGRSVYTRTWPGVRLTGLELDPRGGAVVAGAFTESTDLDPGPGTMAYAGSPGTDYAFVTRLRADGSLDWARVLPGQLRLTSVGVTTEGRVALAGHFEFGAETSFDFDPGPGVAMRPVQPSSHGVFVVALENDGSFAWSTIAAGSGPTAVAGTVLVAPRPDGGILVAGGSAGANVETATGIGPTWPTQTAFVLALDRAGATVRGVVPAMAAVDALTVAPDGTATVLGRNWLAWDADPTFGTDRQESNAVFLPAPAYTVVQLGSDLGYRWSRTFAVPVLVTHVATDAERNLFLWGDADTGNFPDVTALDLDPGERWRWMHPPQRWSAAYTPGGDYRWAALPETRAGVAMRGAASGYYVAGGTAVEGAPDQEVARVGAFSADGHRRYWLRLAGTRRSGGTHLALGAANLRAVGGWFTGTIDHAFGGAAPDPRTAVAAGSEGDAFVTVFTDEGGTAPRCAEVAGEELREYVCPNGRAIRCEELHRSCGTVTDPCRGGSIECGACTAPETCGGGGEANVCGRPAPRVLASGLNHPWHVAPDATHVYFTTYGTYGALQAPPGDAGVTPVDEAGRLWRVARDGSGAPELLLEGRWRPTSLFVARDDVYLWVSLSSGAQSYRVPKRSPSAAAPTGLVATPVAVDGADFFLLDSANNLAVMPADGSAAPRPFATPGPVDARVVFDGGQMFYLAHDGPSGFVSVFVVARSGGNPQRLAGPYHDARLLNVDAARVYFVMRDSFVGDQWWAVPRAGMAPEALVARVPPPNPPTGPLFEAVAGVQLLGYVGSPTAATALGNILSAPVSGSPIARLADGLNHPRGVALDGAEVFVAEEGDYGAHGATGRILRMSR